MDNGFLVKQVLLHLANVNTSSVKVVFCFRLFWFQFLILWDIAVIVIAVNHRVTNQGNTSCYSNYCFHDYYSEKCLADVGE